MTAKPRRVWCATLGCDKNLVDSEALLGRFAAHGFSPVEDPEQAEVWVVNSCGFIDAARRDSAETVVVGYTSFEQDGRFRVLEVAACRRSGRGRCAFRACSSRTERARARVVVAACGFR